MPSGRATGREVAGTEEGSQEVGMREIGEGGMATVYLADNLKHQRKVAYAETRTCLSL